MNIAKHWLTKLLTACLGFGILVGCSSPTNDTSSEPAVRPIKLVTVEESSSTFSRNYPATISTNRSRELAFQVSGLIESIPVSAADQVTEGMLLAKIDPEDYEANLNSVKAQFENAEVEYQRAVRLAEQDAISQSVLEQRKAQRDVAEAALSSAEKALEDTKLVAPFDGVIAQIMATELDVAQPGKPVMTIISIELYEAKINVPANMIATSQQRTGQAVILTLDAAPDIQIPATFGQATLVADATSQTFEVTFLFEAPEELVVLPGMTGSVSITAETVNAEEVGAVSIPLTSILIEGDSKYVWLVDKETMTVTRQEVEVVDGIGENIRITTGLEAGDVIAGAGVNYLAEGMQVRAWSTAK